MNTDGAFTMADLNSFFEALPNYSDSSRKQVFNPYPAEGGYALPLQTV